MKKANIFARHPKLVGLTFWQHFFFALNLSRIAFAIAMASFIHAFFPFIFETFASRNIDKLYKTMTKRLESFRKE